MLRNKMSYLPENIAKRLREKLDRLNSLRPLPKSAVRKLQERFKIEMTYNSNAIEGNSLTLRETFLVINEGITVKGKSLKEHLEAKDHHAALEFLYDLIDNRELCEKQNVSEMLIRNLHQIIIRETDEEWAGKYRNANVVIAGSHHFPPDALKVGSDMQELVKWFNLVKDEINVIELAALFHHKLVYIHPFFDGNGRTARIVMNLLLMQAGYPLVVVLKNDRKKYYDVLDKADRGECEPLVIFIAQAIERSLDIYLKTLTPVDKKQEKFLSLKDLAKEAKFSAKYLNLLARKGRLEAHKEGRNWLASKEAVERYLKSRIRKVNAKTH